MTMQRNLWDIKIKRKVFFNDNPTNNLELKYIFSGTPGSVVNIFLSFIYIVKLSLSLNL